MMTVRKLGSMQRKDGHPSVRTISRNHFNKMSCRREMIDIGSCAGIKMRLCRRGSVLLRVDSMQYTHHIHFTGTSFTDPGVNSLCSCRKHAIVNTRINRTSLFLFRSLLSFTPSSVKRNSSAVGKDSWNSAFPLVSNAIEAGIGKTSRMLLPPPPLFPPGPRGDVALDLLKDPLDFLELMEGRYGDVVGVLLGGERAVIVSDPHVAQYVLVDRPDVFVKSGTAFFPGSSLAGNGLLVSDGEVWRRQRRLAAPSFRKAAVERYATSMIDCTRKNLLDRRKWRPGAVRNVYSDFNELTLQITLNALFGSEDMSSVTALEVTSSIQQCFEYFAQRSVTAFIIPESIPTPSNLRFSRAVSRLDKAVYGLIACRRKNLETQNSQLSEDKLQKGDLLGSLITAKDEDSTGMDDVSLRDELMTLLIAGQETSAILLGWCCAYLAIFPEFQDKVSNEIKDVLGNRPATPDDAKGRLPYLESLILETLRLRPPAYMVGRCAAIDSHLGRFKIPAGTTVLVSPYLIHRSTKSWNDRIEFKPERWLEIMPGAMEQQSSLAMSALSGMGPNGAFIPFGAGPRNCIGTGFAIMEAILVLATILQNFELKPLPGRNRILPSADPQITLRPEHVRLMLCKRK